MTGKIPIIAVKKYTHVKGKENGGYSKKTPWKIGNQKFHSSPTYHFSTYLHLLYQKLVHHMSRTFSFNTSHVMYSHLHQPFHVYFFFQFFFHLAGNHLRFLIFFQQSFIPFGMYLWYFFTTVSFFFIYDSSIFVQFFCVISYFSFFIIISSILPPSLTISSI